VREKTGQGQTVKIGMFTSIRTMSGSAFMTISMASPPFPARATNRCGIHSSSSHALAGMWGNVDHNRPDTGWVQLRQWLLRQFIFKSLCGCCHRLTSVKCVMY